MTWKVSRELIGQKARGCSWPIVTEEGTHQPIEENPVNGSSLGKIVITGHQTYSRPVEDYNVL